MKIDWNKAPDWATHAACNENGVWEWIKDPKISKTMGYYYPSDGVSCEVIREYFDWEKSLTPRPVRSP